MNNNLSIERAILSSIIFENSSIEDLGIKAQDFYMPFHQNLFSVMEKLRADNQPIDDTFLKIELNKSGKFDEVQFLDILAANPISNIQPYVKNLKDLATKREIVKASKEVQSLIMEKEPSSVEAISFLSDKIERIERGAGNKIKARSWLDLMDEFHEPPVYYQTGIPFLDHALDGGFTLGQIVTITGEQESGKTQLLSQILLSAKFQSLYFGLEFNGRQTGEYGKQKISSGANKKSDFATIDIITGDETSGEIEEVISIIKSYVKEKAVKFVAIDSAMMLFTDDPGSLYATTEEKISSVFMKLLKLAEKLDIVILMIGQSSKSDNANGRIEIFGSKKAAHFAKIMIHINFDREAALDGEEYTRKLIVGKNKQSGRLSKTDLAFDNKKLEFYTERERDQALLKEPEANITEEKNAEVGLFPEDGYNEALDITIEDIEEVSDKTKSEINKLAKSGVSFE